MTIKIPIRTVYSGSDPVGLSEFQSGEAIDYTHGGTGLSALGSSGQILKVNSGGTALEWANDDQRDLSTYITSATVSSTYVANTVFQSALANTNSYIASVESTERAALANTNSWITSVESAERAALANTNSYIAATVATNLAELANTNSWITSVESAERAALANTNLYIASVESTERAALANTNLYIDTKFSSANLSITTSAITITSDQGSLDQNDKILANPDGFVTINIGGTNYKLPYYS
jgi:hypothetical protein